MGSRTSKMGVTFVAISVLIVSLLSSGPVPIIDQFDNGMTADDVTTSTAVWHHDCSNMTSFSKQTNNTWALEEGPVEHNVVNGTLESSGAYIYASDFGTSTLYYGPLYSYELTNYVNLADFSELNTVIELSSSTNAEMGRVDVILNDENHAPIMGLSITDGWQADDAILPVAYWMFGNGSFLRVYEGYENSVQTSYSEKVCLYQNSTGFFAELPLIGTFKLVDANQVNQSRSIRYVSIHIMKWNTNPVCNVMKLHNISLYWNTTSLWHDDCSDASVFNKTGDTSWIQDAQPSVFVEWNSFSGNINSSDGYIYATDTGSENPSETDWHGPLRYHTFSNPFTLDYFEELEVGFEIDENGNGTMAMLCVMLHDVSNKSIMNLHVEDGWQYSHEIGITAQRVLSDGTLYSTFAERADDDTLIFPGPYHDSLRIFRNSSGLFCDMVPIGDFELLGGAEPEPSRTVSHISIWIASVDNHTLIETARIHDIKLTWRSLPWPPDDIPTTTTTTTQTTTTTTTQTTTTTTTQSTTTTTTQSTTTTSTPVTTTVPTTTSPIPITNTTGWNWEDLPDPVMFLITGMAGTILVLVVVVGYMRRGQ